MILKLLKRYRKILALIFTALVFVTILLWPHFTPNTANKCYALMMAVIIMWITSPIPIFATSLLIPLGAVLLHVIRDSENNIQSSGNAMAELLGAMFGETIPVLLASFTIAASFTKYRIPFISDNLILKKASRNISMFVLAVMLFIQILSIGMNNLSACMLASSLLANYMKSRNLKSDASKALLMGIVIAGGSAGFISPVSSTQNIFAYHLYKKIDNTLNWWKWLSVSIPVALLSTISGWLWIKTFYSLGGVKNEECEEERDLEEDNNSKVVNENQLIEEKDSLKEASAWKTFGIFSIALLTILLWSLNPINKYFGGSAGVSFLSMALIFGFEILTVSDLAGIPWDIILLVMGALALVHGTQSSGLLLSLGQKLSKLLSGFQSWMQVFVVCCILFLMSTLKSHTIAGLIFIPVVSSFIHNHHHASSLSLFLTSVMTTSIGMAFPFSGLVNLMASSISDGDGNLILRMKDFLLVGFPASIFSLLWIVTLGYWLS